MAETCALHPQIEKTCARCAAIERGRKAGSVKSARKTAACRVNIAKAHVVKAENRRKPKADEELS